MNIDQELRSEPNIIKIFLKRYVLRLDLKTLYMQSNEKGAENSIKKLISLV